MQIPILNGVYTDSGSDFRTSYPVNLIPVPKATGISSEYLRPADGIVSNGTGTGLNRGGINWNGVCYRVIGTELVSISSAGAVTTLGDVGSGGLVTFDYSFDNLAVSSGGRFYYWDGTTLTQNVDPDLGIVLDFKWIDSYYMTTDGESLVVNDLTTDSNGNLIPNYPSISPFKYGSSEIDPDPIVAVLKLRNEAVAVNRNTIEFFDNVGGNLFPFQRLEGAQITKGAVGTHACCIFQQAIAFIGSGRNESPSIYLGVNASVTKIATQEIDIILQGFTEAELALCKVEARIDKSHEFLYVHLPDRTLVFDASATQAAGQQIWFTLTTSTGGFGQYLARDFVWCYDKWLVGDPASGSIGYLTDTISSHWGAKVRWEFATQIIYAESKGAIFYEMELAALAGRTAVGVVATISTSYSLDGISWSQNRSISAGSNGERRQRLVWFQNGSMRNWRAQRFQGDSDSQLTFARIEAKFEALAY